MVTFEKIDVFQFFEDLAKNFGVDTKLFKSDIPYMAFYRCYNNNNFIGFMIIKRSLEPNNFNVYQLPGEYFIISIYTAIDYEIEKAIHSIAPSLEVKFKSVYNKFV